MSLGQAIWIGICQSLSAIFPGTSRSMSTIAAGQMVGLDRPSALEFSFLLSIPTMIAATGWDLLKSLHPGKAELAAGAASSVVMNSQNWIVLAIGFVVSFIVALGVVEWFLMWVRRHGFTVFAIYRIVLGILLLVLGSRLLDTATQKNLRSGHHPRVILLPDSVNKFSTSNDLQPESGRKILC